MATTRSLVIGEVLRELREDAGLSLVEIEVRTAGAIKCSRLSSYERAERVVTVDRLAEVAEFYEVPLRHLVDVIERRCQLVGAA